MNLALSFATQSDPAYLSELCREGTRVGAGRITLADTLGVAHPDAVRWLVDCMRAVVSVPIGVHCHNDFGLGVACSLAAAEAGATWVDLSVNGIGERGGNASLEEFVAALMVIYEANTGIDSVRLMPLSILVSEISHIPVPDGKPVVGANAFASKLDAHVAVAARDPRLLEPYDPTLVGNRRYVRLGKGSGPMAVLAKAEQLGMRLHLEAVDEVVSSVNSFADSFKRFLTDDDFRQIVESVSYREKSDD